MKLLNLACGNSAIFSNDWENCDFLPNTKNIRHVDLLKKFPYLDEEFDLIYCSHFIEHISLENLKFFLDECYRVTKFGGYIRLVTPDFENIAREYLNNLDSNNILYSQFNIVELIDQCTRNFSGGELFKWYKNSRNDIELSTYIFKRTGYSAQAKNENSQSRYLNKIKKITFNKLNIKIQKLTFFTIVKFFPRWIRNNHISYSQSGEKHLWMHDFNSLREFLIKSNFTEVIKVNAFESQFRAFPNYPLDIDREGAPTKGNSSMYVEAFKDFI